MCFRIWTIWHCWCTYDHPSGLNLTNVVVNDLNLTNDVVNDLNLTNVIVNDLNLTNVVVNDLNLTNVVVNDLNLTNVVVNDYLVWVTAVTPIASQHNRFALLRFQWLSINKDKQSNKLDLCNITDTWNYTIIPDSFLSNRLLVVYFQWSVMLCKPF